MSIQEDVADVEESLLTDVCGPIPKEDYLSSGNTLINLACSGTLYGALAKGHYHWMCGDSSSGKTFFTLNCMAEASVNRHFDEYQLIYNNVEDGAKMEVERYFGSRLAQRMKPPKRDKDGSPQFPMTLEEFYYDLDDRLELVKKGKSPPFIELLDSIDALDSEQSGDKFDKKKSAFRKGKSKEEPGEYTDGKAKINSQNIRKIAAKIRDSRCILIVLSQTRDNMTAKTMFDPKTIVSGGRALKFYATWQLWSSVKGKIKKTVNGHDRQIGITSKIAIKKNRLTGKEWDIEVPIYWSSGIDDTGAMVDFLCSEGRWTDTKGIIKADDLGLEGMRTEGLIHHIEQNNLEPDLKQIVFEVWKDIERKCHVERKPRYS